MFSREACPRAAENASRRIRIGDIQISINVRAGDVSSAENFLWTGLKPGIPELRIACSLCGQDSREF